MRSMCSKKLALTRSAVKPTNWVVDFDDTSCSSPKAEVTGSNPVGCANDFNGSHDSSEGSGRRFVRIILVLVAPDVSVLRIARVWKLSNWNTREFAGKPRNIREQ